MNGTWIRQMRPALTRYLDRFSDCFLRKDTRAHMPTYVEGQLSNLNRKSVEPIALAAGVPVRTLQEFLAQYAWDEDAVRDRLQQMVLRERGSKRAIGVFDETSDVKKGIKTPGVQRQWCGKVGKTDNCIVTVHLAFAQEDFHCLLDGELFLPESWSEDRLRCRNAGIPDEMVYRSKWKIALELYDRATANGLEFEWLTFDEGYGAKGPFLLELDKKGQLFIGEVPTTMTGWLKKPKSRTAADGSLSRTTAKRCKDRQRHPQSSIVQTASAGVTQVYQSAVGALPHQRWRQRADGLGSEAHDDLSSRWQNDFE